MSGLLHVLSFSSSKSPLLNGYHPVWVNSATKIPCEEVFEHQRGKMFPSTSLNPNDPNTIALPFINELISNSKQDHDLTLPFSLLNFPSSPFSLYTDEDSALFLQPFMGYSLPDTKISVMEPTEQLVDASRSTNSKKSEHHPRSIVNDKQSVPRKRSSKKDRHSKINTAQGPRDRRMRLSLEVARKFFDLQDMLGFDKGSKTVEWLLTQSNSAIKELSKDYSETYKFVGERALESSPSECDVVSGVIDESVDASNEGDLPEKPEDDSREPLSGKVRKTSRSQASTRRISCGYLARELREKARARAKERTREKMMVRGLRLNDNAKPIDIGGESGTSTQPGHHSMKLPSIEVQAKVEEPKQLGAIAEQTIEDSFTVTSNYLQSNEIVQENQFRDFWFLKLWEAYNGTSYLC